MRSEQRRSTSGWSARLVAAALALLVMPAYADESASMDAEIDYLIESVAESECVFIRNGKEHNAAEARDHLQMKRRRGKRYYDTTEEFIERIASKSSWSGKPYRIRCDSDDAIEARDWFSARLAAYRSDTPQS